MGKTSKILFKRERIGKERSGKDLSRTSTKEMTVKLDFFLAVCWCGNTFLEFQ